MRCCHQWCLTRERRAPGVATTGPGAGAADRVPALVGAAPSCELFVVPLAALFFALVGVSMTVEIPEPLAGRLAAEAARRGVRAGDLAVEAIEGRFGATPGPGSPEARAALDVFIGCADSDDPSWASRDIHELRREAAARKLAEGS